MKRNNKRIKKKFPEITTGKIGYNEIQNPRRKNILIAYDKLMEILGAAKYEQVKQDHQGWSAELLGQGAGDRDEKWTKSIAVGSREFVDNVKAKLGILAKGRQAIKKDAGYQLRERAEFYINHFEVEKGDIDHENSYFWDVSV